MVIMHDNKMFLKILERERSRTDRTGRAFSVILLSTVAPDGNAHAMKALGYLIRKRIRLYDEIGWFDENKIGILLPGTGYAQADTLAAHLCSSILPKKYDAGYCVLTYPEQWVRGVHNNGINPPLNITIPLTEAEMCVSTAD